MESFHFKLFYTIHIIFATQIQTHTYGQKLVLKFKYNIQGHAYVHVYIYIYMISFT
jgi:hypothetical protein